MNAYDIVFEQDGRWVHRDSGKDAIGDVTEAGWTGTDGPAVGDAWPRGELTGLPMAHVLTLKLPQEYRTQGDELVAISFFQGEGQFAEEGDQADAGSDDPFLAQWAHSTDHPTLRRLEDVIGGAFALLWLTQEEFDAGPAAPPEDVRRDGEHENDDEGPNAWDDEVPQDRVGLVLREDPNAGKAPNEDGDDDYQDPLGDQALTDALFGRCHLGGTAFPEQALPEGLTPTYLELPEFEPMNLGSGVLQLDLASDTFDWACG